MARDGLLSEDRVVAEALALRLLAIVAARMRFVALLVQSSIAWSIGVRRRRLRKEDEECKVNVRGS